MVTTVKALHDLAYRHLPPRDLHGFLHDYAARNFRVTSLTECTPMQLAEIILHATVIRACLEAALSHSETGPLGAAFPDELYTNAGKYTGAANYSLMVRHLHDIAGGAIVTAPSISDLESPEVGELARKYMGGAVGDGEYRTRLFHLIRDLTADAYGGWQAVTAIQAGGGLYAQRIVTRKHYDLDRARQMALAAAGMAR